MYSFDNRTDSHLESKAPARVPYINTHSKEQLTLRGEKLGDMMRIPTVSQNEDEDLTLFYEFHKTYFIYGTSRCGRTPYRRIYSSL